MDAIKETDAKWIKSMHYDHYFKTDYESLLTNSKILNCQLNDVSFLRDSNLSSLTNEDRTMISISLSSVRKSLKDMNTLLDAMADVMLRHNQNLLNTIPMPPTDSLRAELDKKIAKLKHSQTALDILSNGMSS